MSKLKFGPISKKMHNVAVTAQACKPDDACWEDCERKVFQGDSSSSISGCTKTTVKDSHWSQCH